MANIKFNGLIYAFCLKIFWAEGRILSNSYHLLPHLLPHPTTALPEDGNANQTPLEKFIELENIAAPQPNKYNEDIGDMLGPDDRCAILVVSNQGQTNLQQSILRKYRYNQDGDLIPGSVQYFIKFPQGNEGPALLVPLKDKAFSSSGGFLRYYKEVPPIPQSWKR